jgi:hypothetical protein
MKLILFISLLGITLLFGENNNDKKLSLEQKHLDRQLKKEKKYAKEQTFYMGNNYDLKDAEVDDESLKNIPEQSDFNDDFDMDSVYD